MQSRVSENLSSCLRIRWENVCQRLPFWKCESFFQTLQELRVLFSVTLNCQVINSQSFEDMQVGYISKNALWMNSLLNEHLSLHIYFGHFGLHRIFRAFKPSYGSVSAGREKCPFNIIFFLKVERSCDQT